MSETAAFERLVKMLEREIELAGNGRVTELERAVQECGEYLKTLPVPAPPAAQPLVLRANALHSRLTIETRRLAEALATRRGARRVARQVARTYTPAPVRRRYSTSA